MYGNTLGVFQNDYEGMTEQVEQGTSIGMQKATVISQKTAIGGPQAGAKQKLEFLDQLKKSIVSNPDINLEAVRSELGTYLTPTEVDSQMEAIETYVGEASWAPSVFDQLRSFPGGAHVLERANRVPLDLRSSVNDVVKLAGEPVDYTELEQLGKSKDFISVQYEKIARASHDLNLTPDQLLDLRKEGSDSEYAQTDSVIKRFNAWEEGSVHRRRGDKDKGSIKRFLEVAMGITDDAAAVGRAHSTPDSPAAMMQARRASLASGQTSEQVIKGVTDSLVTEPSKALSQVQLAVFNQAMQTQTQTEMASLSPGGALKYKVARGKLLQDQGERVLDVNENDEVATQMVQQGETMELEGALGMQGRYKSYLTQIFNFQKQSGRAWEDYYRAAGEAREDFERSEFRATEDHYRQVRYMTQDHHRQQRYAQENFDLQTERQAEDAAGSMMNPFQREQAKPVWSASGLTQNVREQNQDLNRQSRSLKGLSKRGLSDEAIRMLKLSDPGNAQQVFQLEGMSNREIRELNRQAGKRGNIAGRFINSEFNTGTERAKENLGIQFERGDEAFDISLKRGDEALSRSLGRAGDDLERNLERQRKNVSRSLERTKTDINDSLKGIKGDFRDTMNAVSDISESGTTNWNKIMGGGLDDIGGQFDKSGNRWGKSTSKTIKAVDKVLRKFASEGKATPYVDPSSGSTSNNAVGSSAMVSSRFAGVGGFEPGGTTSPASFTGGVGGDVTDAGEGATNWKDEFNQKQDKLMEGIEKFGTLNNIRGGNASAPGGKGVSANAFEMGKYLMDAGLSQSGAAAVIGNLQHESGLSTSVMSSDGHGSVGLAQWTGPRLTGMREYTKGMPGGSSAWKNQLSFLLHELSGYPSLLNRLSSRGNVDDLAYDFEREFERPVPGSHSQRAGYAKTVFDGLSSYSGSTPSASSRDKKMNIWEMGDEIWKRGRAARSATRNSDNTVGGSGTYKGGVPFRSVQGDWAQPMRGYALTQGYSGGHPAYDMVPTQGDPTVYAAGDGTISLKKVQNQDGSFRSYGRYITISHDSGIGTLYAHLSAYAGGVRSGQHVKAGQRIGKYGDTGRSFGAHLHFAVAKGNPEPYSNAVPKSVIGLAKGGIVTKAVNTVIGEGGDSEAVIPLNRGGVETIAEAIAKYSSQYEAKVARTAPYSKAVTNNTYVTDKSTRFTGDISVSSSSPDDFVEALAEKQRSDNLFDVRN